jgi:hypothetical protein
MVNIFENPTWISGFPFKSTLHVPFYSLRVLKSQISPLLTPSLVARRRQKGNGGIKSWIWQNPRAPENYMWKRGDYDESVT